MHHNHALWRTDPCYRGCNLHKQGVIKVSLFQGVLNKGLHSRDNNLDVPYEAATCSSPEGVISCTRLVSSCACGEGVNVM